MKIEDSYDGELDTIFLLLNDTTPTDVQDASTKYLFTAILRKTKTYYVRPNAKKILETILIGIFFFSNTIHSGLIGNCDFNIIYKLIHKVTAVTNNLYHWRIVPTPECFECSDVDTVLYHFSTTLNKNR